MATITCGNCHETHSSAADVRSCYASHPARRGSATPAGRLDAAPSAAPLPLSPGVLEQLSAFDLTSALLDGLAAMPKERHAQVLTFRLGIGGSPPLRLQAIGLKLGVSRERARQLEERAVPLLVQAMKRSGAGQDALRVAARVIAPAEDGWDDRVVGVAHLLLPDAAPSAARRVLMAVSGVKASAKEQKAVRERPGRAARAGQRR